MDPTVIESSPSIDDSFRTQDLQITVPVPQLQSTIVIEQHDKESSLNGKIAKGESPGGYDDERSFWDMIIACCSCFCCVCLEGIVSG